MTPTFIPPLLPDLRNLGVLARILVGVNAALLFAASVFAEHLDMLVDRVFDMALVVEPALLTSLAGMWCAYPWLARLPYWRAVSILSVFVVASALLWQSVGLHAAASEFDLVHALRGVGYALLATFSFAGYFQLRQRAFSPAIAESRLQALQARIRPHFLFNTLNAVLSVVRTDPVRAESALQDLAELYRSTMADNKRLIPLERELELTRQYLNLEQLRLGERLRVEWRVDKAPEDALVPPLLLQPLVENAVYHGIEPGVGEGIIEISVARLRDRIEVRLRNPYHPEHHHRPGNRMAVGNIRERLALHFDAEAQLEADVKGEHYEIRMTMPYKHKQRAP